MIQTILSMEHTTSKPSYADLAQMRQLKQNFSKGANMGKGKEKGGPRGIMAGIRKQHICEGLTLTGEDDASTLYSLEPHTN